MNKNKSNETYQHYIQSSVFGDDDIFIKLKKFSSNLKNIYNNNIPKLYFGKIDVKNAFDSIKQDNLVTLLSKIINEVLYLFNNYKYYY